MWAFAHVETYTFHVQNIKQRAVEIVHRCFNCVASKYLNVIKVGFSCLQRVQI